MERGIGDQIIQLTLGRNSVIVNKPLIALLKRTPGVIIAGEALEDLADDIQAVIIKQLANSPYLPQPLADMQREFSNAA